MVRANCCCASDITLTRKCSKARDQSVRLDANTSGLLPLHVGFTLLGRVMGESERYLSGQSGIQSASLADALQDSIVIVLNEAPDALYSVSDAHSASLDACSALAVTLSFETTSLCS